MIQLDEMQRRPLSKFEKDVFDFIKAYPGRTTEEIALVWGNTEEVYSVIAYLWMAPDGFACIDLVTRGIKAREYENCKSFLDR